MFNLPLELSTKTLGGQYKGNTISRWNNHTSDVT